MGRHQRHWCDSFARNRPYRVGGWAVKNGHQLVAIGRTLQSFLRSKPCGRLSPYTAFRLGLSTLPRRMSSTLPRGAPAKCDHRRHLLSPLNPFTGISFRLALAVLHPVPSITDKHLATTPPPPSLLRAGILAPCLVTG
jgi:hypothetical protein